MSNINDHKLYCVICNFKCCYKSNYVKHLMTHNHTQKTGDTNDYKNGIKKSISDIKKGVNGINELIHVCECGRHYSFQPELSRHEQKRNVTTKPNVIVIQDTVENLDNKNKESLIIVLLAQNKELVKMLMTHQEETKELISIMSTAQSSTP